jgi:hypothetical protein
MSYYNQRVLLYNKMSLFDKDQRMLYHMTKGDILDKNQRVKYYIRNNVLI